MVTVVTGATAGATALGVGRQAGKLSLESTESTALLKRSFKDSHGPCGSGEKVRLGVREGAAKIFRLSIRTGRLQII